MLLLSLPAPAADQHWNLVSSGHFTVLTDAGVDKGHEVVARFEQMRAVFGELLMRNQLRMSEPVEIIAVASPAQYAQLAPPAKGSTGTPGFFLSGEDRIFVVLNASDPDSWRSVEYPLAHYFLNYNYPPTQPWFDEGIAEYFSSLFFTAQKTELGNDPELPPPGATASSTGSQKSLTAILNSTPWLSLPDLLQAKLPAGTDNTHPTIFNAQSWILIHYLISKDKLSETGAYFGLVELQKMPVTQAVQQAFGMPADQLESAVKDYFHSLKPAPALPAQTRHPAPTPQSPNESAIPFSVADVGVSTKQVPPAEAQALRDEMELRIPEKRDQATQDLEKLVSGDRSETVVSDRALAWAHIQKGDTKGAFEQLTSAMQLNSSDPWTRFEIAQATYHAGEKGAKVQGLANMMESLRVVIDRHPEFAEAYNMLGWAQLAGGGPNAALGTLKYAVQYGPRNELYQLRLAKAYVGTKKWDDGAAILTRLEGSQDPEIAAAAKKDLYELPYLKKFGIPPQEEAPQQSKTQQGAKPQGTDQAKADQADESADDEDTTTPVKAPAEPKIDKRPVQFLKGKLVSVDCSSDPAAVLVVAKGPRTLKLRTSDYKSVVVLGADKFSCDWKDISVNVNYRASGKAEGDLVSIEVQ